MKPILLVGLLCAAANAMSLDKTISESYAKVQAAVLLKDVAAMKALWLAYTDPSCVSDSKGKKTSYKKLTEQVEAQMKMIKKVNACKIQILSSKTKGGKTMCTVETAETFVISIQGKDHVFDEVSTVEDTWKKVNGKFKIVGIRTIKETVKQDGKVIEAG